MAIIPYPTTPLPTAITPANSNPHDSPSKGVPNQLVPYTPAITGHNPGAIKHASMLTRKLVNITRLAWDPSHPGKSHLPSSTQLRAVRNVFGQPSRNHSFTREPDLFNIAILLLKGDWLDATSTSNLCSSHTSFSQLWSALTTLAHCNFSSIKQPDKLYTIRTSIPEDRVVKFTACLLFYDLDVSSLICFTEGNYTGAYRTPSHVQNILNTLTATKICPQTIMDQLKRIMLLGCQSKYCSLATIEGWFLSFSSFSYYFNFYISMFMARQMLSPISGYHICTCYLLLCIRQLKERTMNLSLVLIFFCWITSFIL